MSHAPADPAPERVPFMRASTSCLFACLALLAISCGSSEGDGPDENEEVGPLELVSTFPADGDMAVDPAKPMSLEFSRAVSAGSLGIVLEDGAGSAIPVEVKVEGATVEMTAGLGFETAYVLRIVKAEDTLGNALKGAPIEISFGTGPDGSVVKSTFADVSPIFTRSCVRGCHGGGRPEGGLSLEASTAYEHLVNVAGGTSCGAVRTRVTPGEPDASCLWRLVKNGTMPKDGTLPAADKEAIRQWIADGALE